MGTGSHDGVKLPFQLPPGAANECQFTFYVQSFLMPQKLRGTTTYMVKVCTVHMVRSMELCCMHLCCARAMYLNCGISFFESMLLKYYSS